MNNKDSVHPTAQTQYSMVVPGVNVDDTVGVNVEGDLDLGHSAGRGRDSNQLKLS